MMKLSAIVLGIVGAFLILDGIAFHAISFDYYIFNLQALDPFIQHWMIGLVLLGIAVYDGGKKK